MADGMRPSTNKPKDAYGRRGATGAEVMRLADDSGNEAVSILRGDRCHELGELVTKPMRILTRVRFWPEAAGD